MTDPLLPDVDGGTPLSDEEREGLIPSYITLRSELSPIHLYPNGNGRHARLATDLLLVANGHERFSWGRKNLQDAGRTRERYIAALQAADKHDYGPLLGFVRD